MAENKAGCVKPQSISDALFACLPELTKCVFSQPVKGESTSKVIIRPVFLKGSRMYQAESFTENRAFHENLDEAGIISFIDDKLAGRYRQILAVTQSGSRQYVLKNNGSYKCTAKASVPRPGEEQAQHNRSKQYILSEGENIPALVDLGVFSQDFHIVKSKYDKYRQINRFVELIDNEFGGRLPENITILDFGCGKSYLTFIVYYYFTVKKNVKAKIIGYDLKADVVEHCNAVAEKYGYDGLEFVVADVTKDVLYDKNIDMVITLHACDTATDYALHYAMKKGAKYIFSVPCCQHEINSAIRRGGDMDIMLRHGIIKERLSALLTDSIRAAVLEDSGYRVDMIEFVDFEHSPKNIMIRAVKSGRGGRGRREEAERLAAQYGFTQTLLELTKPENQ